MLRFASCFILILWIPLAYSGVCNPSTNPHVCFTFTNGNQVILPGQNYIKAGISLSVSGISGYDLISLQHVNITFYGTCADGSPAAPITLTQLNGNLNWAQAGNSYYPPTNDPLFVVSNGGTPFEYVTIKVGNTYLPNYAESAPQSLFASLYLPTDGTGPCGHIYKNPTYPVHGTLLLGSLKPATQFCALLYSNNPGDNLQIRYNYGQSDQNGGQLYSSAQSCTSSKGNILPSSCLPTAAPITTTSSTTAPTTTAATSAAAELHCSHGYWKNHDGTLGSVRHPQASAWPNRPGTSIQYQPSDVISLIFPGSNSAFWTSTTVISKLQPYGFSASTTLHTALGANGGGLNNVFRQGVAAYFDSLTYPPSVTGFTTAQVQTEFYNQILNNGNGGQLEWWATFCHDTGSTCPPDAVVPIAYQTIYGTCCGSPNIWDTVNNNCPNPPGGSGDPQINGFHGQSFQFHGMADEVFNLISTPVLQLNGHFVYLSSGYCDYTETTCWTHPGTYIDQLGFALNDEYEIKMVAGPHDKGLYIEMNGEVMSYGNYKLPTNGTEIILKYNHHGKVHIKTRDFAFNVINSDMFFNIDTSLLDRHLLRLGSPRHVIKDRKVCKKEEYVDETKFAAAIVEHTHNHGAVEALIDAAYGGAQVPLHGLIGQTWRNVIVCGKHWVGSVSDYIAADLFASDYFFNFYHDE